MAVQVSPDGSLTTSDWRRRSLRDGRMQQTFSALAGIREALAETAKNHSSFPAVRRAAPRQL